MRKKSTLDYKEVYDELVNQNEIPMKRTATKEDLNILEANFNRKIDKMSNVRLEKLQNVLIKLLVQLKSITDLSVITEIKINVLMKLGY